MPQRLRSFLLAILAAATACSVWAFVLEPRLLRNEDHDIVLPSWPASCDGLRVAVIADLHVGSPGKGSETVAALVALTNAAKPDLVLLAGDYVIQGVVGGSFTAPEEIAALLQPLFAPLGVFAVLGNHDWWLDGPRVRKAFESVGIRFLEDDVTKIENGRCEFWLAGISDYREGAHDVPAALAQVSDDAPLLAFTHNPDVFPEVPARVNLLIAGHTHGGQVYLPGIGRPIVPSEYGERFAAGHIVENGRHLFVSTGIGTSILPVRFLVPPEVSVLRIRAASQEMPT